MHMNLTYPGGSRPRLVAGLAVSLLLHVALLSRLRAPTMPPAQEDERRWAQPLSVRLLPPPPAPLPAPAAAPSSDPSSAAPAARPRARPAGRPAAPSRPQERAAAPAPAHDAPAPITLVPAEPATAAAEPGTPAPPAAAPADAEPKFDREAALKSARGMYDQIKPPVTNWAAEKLNKGKEWKETKFERFGKAVAASAREDCKTAYSSSGLFAPLFMLADKKDGGCKF